MKIEYQISYSYEETPVRGNVLASGNDAEDRAAEEEILERLNRGDLWAWCTVKVTAAIVDAPEDDIAAIEGTAYLGCCSYRNKADFRAGGYYEDMCAEALEDLKGALRAKISLGKRASAVLADIG